MISMVRIVDFRWTFMGHSCDLRITARDITWQKHVIAFVFTWKTLKSPSQYYSQYRSQTKCDHYSVKLLRNSVQEYLHYLKIYEVQFIGNYFIHTYCFSLLHYSITCPLYKHNIILYKFLILMLHILSIILT